MQKFSRSSLNPWQQWWTDEGCLLDSESKVSLPKIAEYYSNRKLKVAIMIHPNCREIATGVMRQFWHLQKLLASIFATMKTLFLWKVLLRAALHKLELYGRQKRTCNKLFPLAAAASFHKYTRPRYYLYRVYSMMDQPGSWGVHYVLWIHKN